MPALGGIQGSMKISTVVDLELLRRYAELGHWNAATDLYFDACLEGVNAAACEELHEAVWARDSDRVAAAVGKLAAASRLLVPHGRVRPLPPRTTTAKLAQRADEKRT
jgi:hypothetical protein